MNTQKAREKAVLQTVYDLAQFEHITPGESPDFRIVLPGKAAIFGVEITEFHISESSARLKRIPGYVTELLDSGSFRHKHDMKELTVDRVTYKPRAGVPKEIMAIIKEVPTAAEYADKLLALLNTKAHRATEYMKGLSHVNLVVLDESRVHALAPLADFYKRVYGHDMRLALKGTPFREIFFVTELAKRWLYVPMKMLLFLSELYLLDGALTECAEEVGPLHPHEELIVIGCCLEAKGYEGVRFRQADGYELLWAGYGILVDEHTGVTIREYGDSGMPGDARELALLDEYQATTEAFLAKADAFVDEHTFCGEIGFGLKGTVPT